MKTLLLILFVAVSALAQTVSISPSQPLPVHWMNDQTRKDQAKWDAEHPDPARNRFIIYSLGRPSLIRFNIDGAEYELGARSDGVVVWRLFKP